MEGAYDSPVTISYLPAKCYHWSLSEPLQSWLSLCADDGGKLHLHTATQHSSAELNYNPLQLQLPWENSQRRALLEELFFCPPPPLSLWETMNPGAATVFTRPLLPRNTCAQWLSHCFSHPSIIKIERPKKRQQEALTDSFLLSGASSLTVCSCHHFKKLVMWCRGLEFPDANRTCHHKFNSFGSGRPQICELHFSYTDRQVSDIKATSPALQFASFSILFFSCVCVCVCVWECVICIL